MSKKLELPRYLTEKDELSVYLKGKLESPRYERLVKGQLVWLKQDKLVVRGLRPMEGPVFRPAKVKRSFVRTEPEGGVLLYKENGRVKEVPVDEAIDATLIPMGRENLQCWPEFDPAVLWDISEPAMFHNIRMRFELGYNFMRVCENILLFLNKDFDTDFIALSTLSDDGSKSMKSKKAKKKKKGGDPLACKDDLNSLVERSFSLLVESNGRNSQSIVVNGAEGSGKRDITRFVLLRTVQLSKPPDANWWSKLLSGDLLLQEFGGTGYVRWTELQLFFSNKKKAGNWLRMSKRMDGSGRNNGILIGAVCNAFGLDKSRVTDNAHPLFPIFESLIKQNKLKNADYMYLSKRKKASDLSEGFKEWAETTAAMKALGFSKESMSSIEKLLIGILETGNIKFNKETSEENAKEVLGVRLGELRNAIRVKTLQVKSERFFKERSPKEQENVRDGLSRVLYSLFFDWLTDTINKEIARIEKVVKDAIALGLDTDDDEDAAAFAGKKAAGKTLKGRLSMRMSIQRTKSKGVIGIIGVLETASLVQKDSTLEDLYQNYRLERFHSFFMQDIVAKNSATLQEARVSAPVWYPPGNEEVLGLFMGSVQTSYDLSYSGKPKDLSQKRPSVVRLMAGMYGSSRKNSFKESAQMQMLALSYPRNSAPAGNDGTAGSEKLGVLQLVEEEINMPGGNDKGLARRIIRKKKDNEYLTRATTSDFSIKHFGGNVKYHLDAFIDRSKANSIPTQVLQLLHQKSSNPLIRQVVAFRGNPIQRSGVLNKREVETMMELDNSAVDAVQGSKPSSEGSDEVTELEAVGTDGIDVRKAEVNETAKKLFVEANRAVAILNRTQVQYVISIAANRKGDKFGRFEPYYLLDQIRQNGLTDAVCTRLYNSLRGPGIPRDEFVLKYGQLHGNIHVKAKTKKKPPSLREFCTILASSNLLTDQWELNEGDERVFLNVTSRIALDTALRLMIKPTVIYIQRFARRYLAKCEYIRRMHSKIKRLLRVAIEESSEKDILYNLDQASKWKLQHSILVIAKEKLRRLAREREILEKLDAACDRRNAPDLYKTLQEAKDLGMTGNDFPQVAKALQTFGTMESTQVSKEDVADFKERYDLVALELRIRLNLDVEGLSDSSDDEYETDTEKGENESEYEWVTDDGEGSMGSEFDVLDEE